ncbi:MAG TPA: TraR/DksA family transcriptional regulator [Flavobacteriales bacterium]|nr:TraR/DksA family transcriptional regulator [Flavobacteriales bacterium]
MSLSSTARYSSADLTAFRAIIDAKLTEARNSLDLLEATLMHDGSNGTDDTYAAHNISEDGQVTLEREEAAMLASRQRQFIQQLENARARTLNNTYGICRVSGRLIPRERLLLVPHATLCIDAKAN